MKRQTLLMVVMLILTLAASACAGKSTPTPAPQGEQPAPATAAPAAPAAPAEPVILRIGWAGSPDTLNPGSAMLTEAYNIFELVYSSLVELNLDGTYKLDLAESVNVSDDNLVHTYKLHPGVKFHDGTPLTAKDVVFSFELYMAHDDFAYMNSYTTYFDKVEAPDDSTVVLTLSEPIPNLDSQIVFLFILPQHVWAEHAGDDAAEFANETMIGSGPFKLAEFKQGEIVTLEKNSDYFAAPPKVDRVVFQTFTNEDALVQSIKTGQVDMITEMPNTAVATLRNTENVKVVTGAPLAPDITDIILNQADPETCPAEEGGVCSGHPALRDVRVRQALAYATNKQELVDIVLLGLGTPGLTLIPDSLGLWYNAGLQDYAFNLAEANRILDEAGYKDSNGDKVREMPDGSRELALRLNYPSDSTVAPRLSELLAKTWEQAGVKLEIQALDPDAVTSICCPAFDYDVLVWGWGSDPDPNFLLSVMLSSEISTGMSETGYNSEEYDALYEKQSKEMDPEKRKQIIWDMQELLLKDVVYIVPFYAREVQAFRTDRFSGWILDQPKMSLQDVSSLMVVEAVK